MFLDTWLDRPEFLPIYLKISDVEECDYIFISHAHFDQYVSRLQAVKNLDSLTSEILLAYLVLINWRRRQVQLSSATGRLSMSCVLLEYRSPSSWRLQEGNGFLCLPSRREKKPLPTLVQVLQELQSCQTLKMRPSPSMRGLHFMQCYHRVITQRIRSS